MASFFILISLVLSSSVGFAQPKKELLNRMRNELPEKALTLDLVLSYALLKSDSFKLVAAENISSVAPALEAKSFFDTQLTISQSWLRDHNESSNAFAPNRTDADAFSIAVSKYFSTGTGLAVDVSRGYNEIGFPTGSFVTVPPYYESKASVALTQNLWADFLGYSSRKTLKAAQLATEASGVNFQAEVENWSLRMIGTYYSAWYSQGQALAARGGLARRERLLKVAKIRLKRGTSETPDYLQIESAYLMAKAQKLEADRSLNDQWRNLVILLKLPQEWINIDSIDVPILIDNIVQESQKTCEGFENKTLTPRESSTQRKAQYLAESAQLKLEAAKGEMWPDLEVQGRYFVNGIDPDSGEATQQALDQDYDGWAVSLVLKTPFEFNAQKAKLARASAEKLQADALKSSAIDDRDLNWINECANLNRLVITRNDAEQTFKNQIRRANLEEKRFQIGRTTTFNVIQAGDDATSAEIFLRASEVELRQSAWKVLALNSQIGPKLETYVKKHGGDFKLEKAD